MLIPHCQAQIGQMGSAGTGSGTMFPGRAGDEHLMTLTPYVQLLGTYDVSNSIGSSGISSQPQQYSSSGLTAAAGLDGYHYWSKSTLGLTFRFNYRHFMKAPVPDTNDEFLSFGFQHQLSHRVSFSLTETGGSSTRAVSGAAFSLGNSIALPGLGSVDQSLSALPTNEIFDGRVYYSSTSAQVTFQRTARQSFFAGGGGFFIRRSQSGAAGTNGVSGHVGTEYLLTRRQSISLQYAVMRYDYTGTYGSVNAHMGGLAYGVMLNRQWNFRAQGGAYRVYVIQPMRVTLDPSVAALLGQSSSIQTYKGASIRGMANASLNGSFRRSSVSIAYSRSMSPGNSVFLTSELDTGMASYSYLMSKRLSAALGAYYSHQAPLSKDYKPLEMVGGMASFSYRVTDPIHFTASVTTRHVLLTGPNYRPTSANVSVGIGYSPTGGLPLW